jgi:hypothetical protein
MLARCWCAMAAITSATAQATNVQPRRELRTTTAALLDQPLVAAIVQGRNWPSSDLALN